MNTYPDRLKLPLSFDVPQLKQDLQRLAGIEWIDHFVKQNYEGNWSAIGLRMQAQAKDMHPVMSIVSDPACTEWVNSPYLEQFPYFQTVLDSFQCPLEAVRLMRLTAGSEIKEHYDHTMSFEEGSVRLHIPIQTHPDVEFYLNDQRVIMQEGECWYLRLSDPHRLFNKSEQDRIHIVIDAQVNSWLEVFFQ